MPVSSYISSSAYITPKVLTTNSYGANFANLSKFGLGDKVAEINAASVRIARKIAGDALMVAGSVGPVDIENDAEAVILPLSEIEKHPEAIEKFGEKLFAVQLFALGTCQV